MLSVFLGFKDYVNLALFGAMWAVIGLWGYRCFKNKARINLVALCAVNIGLLLLWSRLSGLDMDEVEHLHCSWMVSQGLVPFKDFWQHHSPLLWAMLAPVMKVIPQTTFVFEMSRLFGACVYVCIGAVGWSISRKIWGKDAQWPVYLLLLTSGAVLGEYFWLRPDILNALFVLAGVRVSLDIPGKRIFPSFAAGVSFGLAMAFVPKQFLLCLLPMAVIIGERHKQWPSKLFGLVFGFLLGLAPLVWYLVSYNIVPDFIQWVVLFNRKIMVVSVLLPLANVFAGVWAVWMLKGRHRASHDMRLLILIAAVVISTVNSMISLFMINGGYYLVCWFVLIAAAGSALPLWDIGNKNMSMVARSSLTGMILALLIFPNMYGARFHENGSFSNDKKVVSRILEYSRGGQCVVLLPFNPVFVLDATRIYSDWQFRFIDKHGIVRDDAKRKAISAGIISARPAVVACRYGRRDFILELYQKKLISAAEYKELVAFLSSNYRQEQIGDEAYYVRNDLLQAL